MIAIVFLGCLSAPVQAADETVRLHVLVSPDGSAAAPFARQAAQGSRLAAGVEARGGRVQPFLPATTGLARRASALDEQARTALERVARWFVVELGVEQASAWRASAASDPSILRVEVPTPIESARAIEIDDPAYPNLQDWMFDVLDVAPAWDVVHADDGDVIAAVVDEGFDIEHPELRPNLWVNTGEIPDNDIDDDGNGFVDDVHGFNVTTGDGDVLHLPEFPDSRRHGTQVAGMLGAAVDNGVAGAGLAFNPRMMLVSVQDESGQGLDPTYSYRGILYAALNGASVVNCSWRAIWYRRPSDTYADSAPFRQFENDVVEAATALGALVVAAAGNEARADLVTSPGMYPAVLAVAATNDRSNPYQLWQNSNSGAWVDLAAPGDRVFSIFPDGVTGYASGTSFAAPIVSAAAVLVKTRWPDWTPAQIRARLRATARGLDATEPVSERRGGSGRGMVQFGPAINAPTIPALEIRDVHLVDDRGTPVFAPGDDVALSFEARSLFPYDGPVVVRVETDDPYLVPFETSITLSQVLEGVPLSVRRGLEFKIRLTTPPGHVAVVDLIVEAGNEVDRQSFFVEVVPSQFDVRSAELEMTVAPSGKLGYSEYNRAVTSPGVGFRRIGDLESSLYFGSLVLGTGPSQIVDAVQAFVPSTAIEGFRPLDASDVEPVTIETGDDGWTRTTLRMVSAARTDGLSVRVDQTTYAHQDAARGDFVISCWRVTPLALGVARGGATVPESWTNVHAAVLADWTASGAGEVVHTDAATGTQWAAPRDGAAGGRFVGARVLTADVPYRAAHFDAVGPDDEEDVAFMIDRQKLGKAMPDSMLWSVISPLASSTTPREGNVVGVLGNGPHPPVPVGESVDLVVGFSIADSRDELFDALERARVAWTSLREGGDGLPSPRLQLLQNTPNPFNPRTTLRFALAEAGPVTVDLFDARGRRVHRLVDERRAAGYHRVEWDGRDDDGREVASGVYFVRVRTRTDVATGRMVLVR